jgi:hypothetical protein
MTTYDKIGAGVIGFVGNLIPFLIVLDVITWTGKTVGACMLVVNSTVTLGGLIFQSVQHKPAVSPTQAPTKPTTTP